jgi:hypothetical protein
MELLPLLLRNQTIFNDIPLNDISQIGGWAFVSRLGIAKIVVELQLHSRQGCPLNVPT